MYTKEEGLAGLVWRGPGWYASRVTPRGVITRKVGEVAREGYYTPAGTLGWKENRSFAQSANDAAREAGYGTPFYLMSPNDL